MRELLRRLAEVEPTHLPVLSVYLDWRPHATGESPGPQSGEVVLKDRLRQIEKTLGPRGESLDSFQVDTARIGRYLDDEVSPAAQGPAIFTCAGQNLFEFVETRAVRDPGRRRPATRPVPDRPRDG
jgi:hypothetical protein